MFQMHINKRHGHYFHKSVIYARQFSNGTDLLMIIYSILEDVG